MPSLEEALSALAAGEPDAATRVALVAGPRARRWAAELVEPAAVDDVVQESLVELLGTAARLRNPDAASAWLRLIVRKQAERHRRRLRPSLPLDLAAEFPSPAHGPEAELLRDVQIGAVRRALDTAPDADRRLLLLRYAGDWTDAELAELLGITQGAVRKRLYDARRRLRATLTSTPDLTTKEDKPMPTVPFGAIISPADLAAQPAPPALRPPDADVLATGLRVLDAVVPIRRGGTVDLLGPVGTGHLVVVSEIAQNLNATGRSAVVGVASSLKADDTTSARLQRMVDADGVPNLTVIVDATIDAAGALNVAGSLAANLASDGTDVLLLVDRVTANLVGAAACVATSGCVGGGSVTTVRVAPHARDAEPIDAWPLDATIVMSLERFAAGIYPAVDVMASRSTLIDRGLLDPEAVQVSQSVRDTLARAAALDARLAQALFVAEAYTGVPGQRVTAQQALKELAAALSGPLG